jgi:DNA-binding response OmpR family regulator
LVDRLSVSLRRTAATILVVDDDPHIRASLTEALELEGYQVQVAESGVQALALMARTPPSLVLLDLMIPGINGWQVLESMRRAPRLSHIPVFIVTAMPDTSGVGGGHPIFTKPLKLDRMMRTIAAFLSPGRNSP